MNFEYFESAVLPQSPAAPETELLLRVTLALHVRRGDQAERKDFSGTNQMQYLRVVALQDWDPCGCWTNQNLVSGFTIISAFEPAADA